MISKYGEGAGVLQRIQGEGNKVELYITEKENRKIYDDILPKRKSLPYDGDVYIFDMVGNGDIADYLANQGKRVINGGTFADSIEEDRNDGIELMKQIGVPIPETKFFNSYEDGKQFLKDNQDKEWVFKPCGRGLPTKLTYKSSDIEQMYRYLTYVEKEFKAEKLEFLLQEFIEGVALSTEGWFDGKKFIRPFNHTIENKKYGVDNLGPSTGCEGNIVWASEEDAIVQTLLKLEPILEKEDIIGQIDLNCIVNKSGFYGLEWTSFRFGFDATPALFRLFNDDVGKFFAELSEVPIGTGYAGSVRVSIPPYPLEVLEDEEMPHSGGLPISGVEIDDLDYYFFEVMKSDEGLVHSGGVGLIACALSESDDYEDVLDDAYNLADEIKVPDKYYRTDLQDVITDDFEEVFECLENLKVVS